jgi:hypothetical protein
MPADRHLSDEEVCPVCDELLGELYSASKLGLLVVAPTVALDIRAMLALFCYRRSHLHAMGLVAASCDEEDLLRSGERVGAILFVKSREAPQPSSVASRYVSRHGCGTFAAPGVVLGAS